MKHLLYTSILTLLFSFYSTAQIRKFNLQDFYKYDSNLEYSVDSIFNTLTNHEKIAQMIITSTGELGRSETIVNKLVKQKSIGGVLFLKGSKQAHTENIMKLNAISSKNNSLPLLFSLDAEPSLLYKRINDSKDVGKTIDIKNYKQSDSIVSIINSELREIGIHHNYAPVLDISPNNEAIKSRSYGSNKDSVINLANRFIKCTQEGGIIATAKHFPGHGLVKGDTHKQSVYIDGKLQEVDNYKKIIKDGVLSIMVAHITIQNNPTYETDSLPSSCSRKIITGLLKEKMGFKGVIISDALNIMKAVTILDNAPLLASKAGCDLILMPQNEEKILKDILTLIKTDSAYKKQVMQSVKKIIRLKVCSGVIEL